MGSQWHWKEFSKNDFFFKSFRWLHRSLYREESSDTSWHYADDKSWKEQQDQPQTRRDQWFGDVVRWTVEEICFRNDFVLLSRLHLKRKFERKVEMEVGTTKIWMTLDTIACKAIRGDSVGWCLRKSKTLLVTSCQDLRLDFYHERTYTAVVLC